MVLILAIIAVVLFVVKGSTKGKYEKQLKVAERYLEELDYERAVAAYKKAIEIDPKKPEAVTGMTDAYVAWIKEELDVLNIEIAEGRISAALSALDDAEKYGADEELIEEQKERIERLRPEEKNTDNVEEADELSVKTNELINYYEEYRNEKDTLTQQEKDEKYTYYAQEFENYIALYIDTNGTGDCTCGILDDSGWHRNDKDYFDIGNAYDLAISFRLMTDDEDKAWKLRSEQAQNSGLTVLLEGFTCVLDSDNPIYYDNSGQVITIEHDGGGTMNATSTYDKFGRVIAIDEYDEETDKTWHMEYVYGSRNRIIRRYDYNHWTEIQYDENGNMINSAIEIVE